MPAIRDFSQAYTTSTSGTTILVPMPAYEQNDLLIAVLTADTGTATWSASGWTERFRQTNTSQLCVMYKIAGASESDVTFTASAAETFNGAIISIRDINTSTPFNGTDGNKNSSLAKDTFPTVTTNIDNCLILFLSSKSTATVPSAIEGPVTLLFGKDGSAHADGCGWGFQAAQGTTSSNVTLSCLTAVAGKLATICIAPPSGGATVIPGYCVADSSTYLSPFTGAAFNGDAALVNTVTTDFDTSLNGKTLTTAAATYTRADYGINSYHAMANVTGVITAGTWAGDVYRFATANKPNVSGKNVIFHIRPYLPVDIQTTDSVSLTGTMGVAIGLCSSANVDYQWWHVHGAGTSWTPQQLTPVVINTGNTSGVIQTTGTLDATSIYSIGLAVAGRNVVPDWVFGSVWALDTTVVAGGNSTEPLEINGILNAAAAGHERMSVIQQGSSQMMIFQPLQFGDGGTNPVYLDLDSTAIEFPRQYNKALKTINYCSTDNVAGIKYYPGGSDTIKHRNSVISSLSRFHWGLHASASTSAAYDFSGTAVIGAGTITLNKAVTINRLTINDYSALDASGLTLTNSTIINVPAGNDTLTTNSSTNIDYCTINVTGVSSGNRWCSVADPTIFSGCSFTGGGGHAIRITATGTYNLVGNTFTGFGSTGTNNAAIFNDSGGTVTLNISGGGSTPTYKNGTNALTTVNNTVDLNVTVLDTGNGPIPTAQVAIYKVSDDSQIMNEDTRNITAGSFATGTVYRIVTVGTTDFTAIGAASNTVGVVFTATGAGSGNGTATDGLATEQFNFASNTAIYVRVRKSSSGETKYVPVSTTGMITADGYSLTVTLFQDEIA